MHTTTNTSQRSATKSTHLGGVGGGPTLYASHMPSMLLTRNSEYTATMTVTISNPSMDGMKPRSSSPCARTSTSQHVATQSPA